MTWQLALCFSILANALTIIIQRRYSQRSSVPATFPPAVSYVLGVMPVGLAVGLSMPHQVHWSWWLVALLAIGGLAMAVANWIGFKAVKLLPVAPYQTISRFYEIVVIALGWVLLGEGLGTYQVLGGAILLTASILAIWAPAKSADTSRRKLHLQAAALTILAATALGIGLVTEKAVLGHMQYGGVLIFGWGAQTLGMIFLAAKDANRKTLRSFGKYELRWSVYMGLAGGATGAFYVFAIQRANNISLVTALTAVTLPLVVLGAHVFLKERDNQRLMWAGLGLSFIGLLVTAIQ